MIDHMIDPKKRYHLDLDPSFPFAIKLFSYNGVSPPFPLNWHERLELFIPTAGRGAFLMGDRSIPFASGDVLIIDNLKLHGLASFSGSSRRAMVVTFLPEFVYRLGSPVCDSLFLMPFYCQPASAPPIVRSSDRLAVALHSALYRLAECYFGAAGGPNFQAGCKAYLLEVLYILGAHFGWSESARKEYARRQEQSQLLGKLHEYLLEHFAERISIGSAAAMVGMSESRFMRYFKSVTGETFVSYLNRLRVEKADQLLRETNFSIAEIAGQVGFADQSYFDKVYRRHFRQTPREARGKLIALPSGRAGEQTRAARGVRR